MSRAESITIDEAKDEIYFIARLALPFIFILYYMRERSHPKAAPLCAA